MKTGKIIFGIIFILSLSVNAAFLIQFFTAEAETPARQLNLTEEQKKQMEPIQVKMHRENEAIKTKISQCQEKLLAALKADPVDRTAINSFIENISRLQKKIQQNTIEEIIQIRNYMNPEQCNCLIDNLGAALDNTSKPCNCPSCRAHGNN
ncbi:MAG: periplasmic heavy metal sensor [bacterium]|nr:periplasmic heavy metal sensor [bacterium]